MTYEPSTDFGLIRDVMTHPEIWDMISDDFTPPIESWWPARADSVLYVIVRDDGLAVGLWMFVLHSPVLWEVHTCLLPGCGHSRSRVAARGMAEWLWANTCCRRLFTQVPDYNRAARLLSVAAGMVQYGNNQKAYQKGGKLHDLIQFGMSRPETA